MALKNVKGVISALATPFGRDGKVNEEVLRELVQFQMSKGVHGFFVCGSTGEGLLMTVEERKFVSSVVVDEVDGKVPVIVHVGAMDTRSAAELAKHAEEICATAVSSIAPIYYKYDQRAIFEHYKAIANASSLPLIFYNIPAATGTPLTKELLDKLLKLPTLAGVKNTDPDVSRLYMLTKIEGLTILNGYDEVFLPALIMGADGMVGSTVNLVPSLFVEIYESFLKGDLWRSRDLQRKVNDLIESRLKYGDIPSVKATLHLMGFDVGSPRQPIRALTPEEIEWLKRDLKALGVI